MKRLTRAETGVGILALVVALAGGSYMTSELQAQGPNAGQGRVGGGGPGGPGRGMGRGGPGAPGPMGELMLRRLNLTEAQQTQVKQIRDSHKEEQRALGDRSRAAHQALQAAITATELNEGAVRAAASELANVESDIAVQHARIYHEVLQVLTAEQKAELTKLQADMKARQAQMQQRRQEGRGQRP